MPIIICPSLRVQLVQDTLEWTNYSVPYNFFQIDIIFWSDKYFYILN